MSLIFEVNECLQLIKLGLFGVTGLFGASELSANIFFGCLIRFEKVYFCFKVNSKKSNLQQDIYCFCAS